MIIESERDVTTAVLAELERAPNGRFREIMTALVRHLHGFMRETKLSEEEFRSALDYIVALGKHSSASHNEAVLMAGSLGVSALVCLINNAASGAGNGPEPAGSILARAGACDAQWRQHRALAHARRSAVRACLVSRRSRRRRGGRGSRRLALLAGRLLRESGSRAG
jgi:hypothetical protein